MDRRYAVLAITVGYLTVLGLVSFWVRRSSKTAQGYTEGGRQFPAMVIGFLMVSEFIGTAVSVGTAQLGYTVGISAAWNLFALAAGFILFAFILAGKYKELGINTISGVLAACYGERTRFAASCITICALQTVAISIYAGGGAVLASVLGIGREVAIAVVGVLSVFYVIIGGMRSVVYTNVIHASVKYIGVFVALAYGLSEVGGMAKLSEALPASAFAWDTIGWPQIGAWMVAGIGSIFATQQVVQAIATVPDGGAARRAGLYCGVLLIPFGIGAAMVGMAAAVLHPGIPSVQAFPSLLSGMGRLSAGLVVAGLAASLFGTISAISMGSATLLLKDFFDPFFNPGGDDGRSVRFVRWATVVVGLLPVALAIGSSNILYLAYLGKALRASLAVLVLLAFYAPRFGGAAAAFWGLVVSLPVTVGWYLLGNPYGVDNAYLAFLVPLTVMAVGDLVARWKSVPAPLAQTPN